MEITIRNNDEIITLEVQESEFAELIKNDQAERSRKAKREVEPRDPQTILDEEFNKPDYNAWHAYTRQDKKSAHFSLEAFNEHGNQLEISTPSVEEEYIKDELSPTLLSALAKLTEKQRAAFLLTELRQLPKQEVAAIIGVSAGRVSQLLAAARSNLQKEILANP